MVSRGAACPPVLPGVAVWLDCADRNKSQKRTRWKASVPLSDCIEPNCPMAWMVCTGEIDFCFTYVTGRVGVRVAAVEAPQRMRLICNENSTYTVIKGLSSVLFLSVLF